MLCIGRLLGFQSKLFGGFFPAAPPLGACLPLGGELLLPFENLRLSELQQIFRRFRVERFVQLDTEDVLQHRLQAVGGGSFFLIEVGLAVPVVDRFQVVVFALAQQLTREVDDDVAGQLAIALAQSSFIADVVEAMDQSAVQIGQRRVRRQYLAGVLFLEAGNGFFPRAQSGAALADPFDQIVESLLTLRQVRTVNTGGNGKRFGWMSNHGV